jgi:hypothetical protein
MNRQIGRIAPAVFALAAAASIACAQAPETTTVTTERTLWGALMDNAVGLTILFIMLSAIIGALIKNRRRDRVLKDFSDYRVTVVLDDGRRIWGDAKVFPNGIEIVYENPVRDGSGHDETSFFIHAAEFPAVCAILRPVEALTPEMTRRRKRELRKYISPTVFRRTWRFLMIQFSVLRDAFVQAFSLLIGQAKTIARPGRGFGTVLQTQDKQITTIGQTVIGAVNLANDPVLESLFGQACVTEIKEGDGWRELPGFLKEYSADWLLLLRAGWPVKLTMELAPDASETQAGNRKIFLRREGSVYTIDNREVRNVELLSIAGGAVSHDLDGREVLKGNAMKLEGLQLEQGAPVVLTINYIEPGDLIVARSKCLVRHRGTKEDLSLLENLGVRRK